MNACVPWNEYFVYSEIAQIVWLGSKHVYKTNERTPMSSFTSAIIIVSLTNEWESWQKDDMLVCLPLTYDDCKLRVVTCSMC